jgi:hypothetical protein
MKSTIQAATGRGNEDREESKSLPALTRLELDEFIKTSERKHRLEIDERTGLMKRTIQRQQNSLESSLSIAKANHALQEISDQVEEKREYIDCNWGALENMPQDRPTYHSTSSLKLLKYQLDKTLSRMNSRPATPRFQTTRTWTPVLEGWKG